MKLSTRVRYGVRAMIELAKQKPGNHVPLRKLAENQAISTKYLEQMVAALKTAGLVESVRGAEGGYRLAKPANQITVLDIYKVLDVSGDPIDCLSPPCDRMLFCSTRELWAEMITAINKVLKSKTIKQLADRENKLIKDHKTTKKVS